MMDTFYHIYVNGKCVSAALSQEELKTELKYIKGFLELTNLNDKATIETVACEPSLNTVEASY